MYEPLPLLFTYSAELNGYLYLTKLLNNKYNINFNDLTEVKISTNDNIDTSKILYYKNIYFIDFKKIKLIENENLFKFIKVILISNTKTKYQFIKYSNDQKIIHMKISKSIIDGKEKDLSIVDKVFKNLILEVQFECLKIEIVNNIKKLLSQYQISVEKFLLGNYLRGLRSNNSENILYIAQKFVSGKIVNEVTWNKKKPIVRNFFERFFNFFK